MSGVLAHGKQFPCHLPPAGGGADGDAVCPLRKMPSPCFFLFFPLNLDICESCRSTSAVGVVRHGIDIYVMVVLLSSLHHSICRVFAFNILVIKFVL